MHSNYLLYIVVLLFIVVASVMVFESVTVSDALHLIAVPLVIASVTLCAIFTYQAIAERQQCVNDVINFFKVTGFAFV